MWAYQAMLEDPGLRTYQSLQTEEGCGIFTLTLQRRASVLRQWPPCHLTTQLMTNGTAQGPLFGSTATADMADLFAARLPCYWFFWDSSSAAFMVGFDGNLPRIRMTWAGESPVKNCAVCHNWSGKPTLIMGSSFWQHPVLMRAFQKELHLAFGLLALLSCCRDHYPTAVADAVFLLITESVFPTFHWGEVASASPRTFELLAPA